MLEWYMYKNEGPRAKKGSFTFAIRTYGVGTHRMLKVYHDEFYDALVAEAESDEELKQIAETFANELKEV